MRWDSFKDGSRAFLVFVCPSRFTSVTNDPIWCSLWSQRKWYNWENKTFLISCLHLWYLHFNCDITQSFGFILDVCRFIKLYLRDANHSSFLLVGDFKFRSSFKSGNNRKIILISSAMTAISLKQLWNRKFLWNIFQSKTVF